MKNPQSGERCEELASVAWGSVRSGGAEALHDRPVSLAMADANTKVRRLTWWAGHPAVAVSHLRRGRVRQALS